MIILDTNVLSELLRPIPSPQVEQWFAEQEGADLYFTAIGEAEIRYGLALLPEGQRKERLQNAVEDIFEKDFARRIMSFNRQAARVYADIAAHRRAKGKPISQFDCQIAAIVSIHGAMLATRNTTDFEDCNIGLLNPWEDQAGSG